MVVFYDTLLLAPFVDSAEVYVRRYKEQIPAGGGGPQPLDKIHFQFLSFQSNMSSGLFSVWKSNTEGQHFLYGTVYGSKSWTTKFKYKSLGDVQVPIKETDLINTNASITSLHPRMPGWIHDHIGCISPLCIFKCVLKWMRERMHNHTGCICLTFLHCWFSNVSSKRWN